MSIGVLFTGKGKTVVDEDCQPIMQCSGLPRMGRGFAESTFRKNYHALRTLHVHLRDKSSKKLLETSGFHRVSLHTAKSAINIHIEISTLYQTTLDKEFISSNFH